MKVIVFWGDNAELNAFVFRSFKEKTASDAVSSEKFCWEELRFDLNWITPL